MHAIILTYYVHGRMNLYIGNLYARLRLHNANNGTSMDRVHSPAPEMLREVTQAYVNNMHYVMPYMLGTRGYTSG